MLQTFVNGNVVSHFVKATVINTYLTEVHGDVYTLEECVGGLDSFLRDFLLGQSCIDAEHVDAVFHKAVDGLFTEDMLHPTRRDDSQTFAVGDVVVGREGVLDAVAGPSAGAVAK